jgi:hypothetical protein
VVLVVVTCTVLSTKYEAFPVRTAVVTVNGELAKIVDATPPG